MTRSPRRTLTEPMVRTLAERFPDLSTIDFSGWIVGGAVRDLILDRPFPDVDIACARAREHARSWASRIGGRFVDLGGERFPTFRIVRKGRTYDLSEIEGGTIDADLGRRDFTINALAVALGERAIVDPFGGTGDLQRRCLRMVSEANVASDPVRIVRGIRLVADLGFELESSTAVAFAVHGRELMRVAPERVAAELDRILASPWAPRGLRALRDAGIDVTLLGAPLDDRSIDAVARIAARSDSVLARAILFRGRDRAAVEAFARRWRWSRSDRESVVRLAGAFQHVTRERDADRIALKLHHLGPVGSERVVAMLRATLHEERARLVEELIAKHSDALFATEALIDGHEIARITGLAPGPAIGAIKRALVVARIRGEVTSMDDAIRWVKGHAVRKNPKEP